MITLKIKSLNLFVTSKTPTELFMSKWKLWQLCDSFLSKIKIKRKKIGIVHFFRGENNSNAFKTARPSDMRVCL